MTAPSAGRSTGQSRTEQRPPLSPCEHRRGDGFDLDPMPRASPREPMFEHRTGLRGGVPVMRGCGSNAHPQRRLLLKLCPKAGADAGCAIARAY